MLIINFKSYKEATGEKAVQIGKTAEKVSKKFNVPVILAPQIADLQAVKNSVSLPVISQHVDPVYEGKYTGRISILSLLSLGIKGSLLNHSEKRVSLQTMKKTVELAKRYKFKIFALASNLRMAKKIARLNPYALAFEPPELIGTGRSVSKAKPQILKKFVSLVNGISPRIKKLCGAGITNYEDVKKALELGVDGVLVASAIVLANNKKKIISDLLKPFNAYTSLL